MDIEHWWPALPFGFLGIFLAFMFRDMIRRRIMRSPPTRSDPIPGDEQCAAWGPICEPIGSCLVALWHLFTCGLTRKASPHNQDHQHGQVEAVDRPASDGIELQNVSGRPKRSYEEQEVPVNDDRERNALESNDGQVDGPPPTSKAKSVWNRMMLFGKGSKTIAGPKYSEQGPSQPYRRQVEHTAVSPNDRNQQRRDDTLNAAEQLYDVIWEE